VASTTAIVYVQRRRRRRRRLGWSLDLGGLSMCAGGLRGSRTRRVERVRGGTARTDGSRAVNSHSEVTSRMGRCSFAGHETREQAGVLLRGLHRSLLSPGRTLWCLLSTSGLERIGHRRRTWAYARGYGGLASNGYMIVHYTIL